MNNFNYCAPTNYVFGNDAELQAGIMSQRYLGKNILVIYGGGSAKRSGLLDRVEKSLTDSGIKYTLFGGIQPNPTDTPVRKAIEIVREKSISGILAVGGGSVIDTAKAIALGTLYQGDFWDFYIGKAKVEKALPIGVILTIPAAGSEGSGNSVITLEDGMRKISLRGGEVIRPKFSLLNPTLTYTLPQYQTASGIVDMMAHILERYFTPTTNVEVSDRLCEGLLMAIMAEAPKVMENPADYQSRANIMWAGTLSHNDICGVDRTQEWVSHGIEHELSAMYGVTHGAGLAVIFPAYLKFMAKHNAKRVAQLGRRVFNGSGSDENAAQTAITSLRAFFKSLGMPLTIAELGIANPDIPTLVRKLHENKGETFGAYFPITPEYSTEIYHLAL